MKPSTAATVTSTTAKTDSASSASRQLTRRDFLYAGGAGLAAALMPRALASAANAAIDAATSSASAPAPGAPDKRPNILYIWTDQQTRSAMSNAGNRHLSTPWMDSLARDGVAFERCYSSNPICMPSRASWLTGSMPFQTGVLTNSSAESGTSGKRPLAASETAAASASVASDSLPKKEKNAKPEKGAKPDKKSKQADNNSTLNPGLLPLSHLMKEAGYDTGYVGKWHISHKVTDSAWSGFDYAEPLSSGDGGVDPRAPAKCEEFLKRKRDKPFFLVAAFVNPHDICEWARLASGFGSPMKNGAPVTTTPPLDQCPPLPENLAIPDGEPSVIREEQRSTRDVYPVRDWPDDKWRQYRWAYYRLIEAVDAQIGKVLRALKETGQDDNTLIIFSSDHGDGTGAHHWNQKTMFYEEISGIPFIVRPPRAGAGAAAAKAAGLGRRDTKSFVSMNLDFYPTIFDYAGVKTPAGLRGCSLRPLVEGRPDAKAHDFAFSANHLPHIGVDEENKAGSLGRMIRTERYKYVHFSSGENREQLFDLQNDPGELRDLKTDAAHAAALAEHRALMNQWLRDIGDPLVNKPCWNVIT